MRKNIVSGEWESEAEWPTMDEQRSHWNKKEAAELNRIAELEAQWMRKDREDERGRIGNELRETQDEAQEMWEEAMYGDD